MLPRGKASLRRHPRHQRIVTNVCRRTQAVSKRLAEGYKIPATTSCVNHRLIMRLLPMSSDKSWRSIKAQWKKDAESVGEDFSTFSNGSYAAFDALTKDGDNPTLYCLSDGEKIHAACQVSRLMMSKFPTPILRARFVVVSPLYELGVATSGQYAQTMVALFSGIVWLSRDTLSAGHVRFFLKSPGDAQFFAALQVVTELSPFSAFAIDGALIECSLKEAEVPEMA
ncbi:hypothetical protein [Bradyrhizobium sp. AUGA SZCCT0160]|uniref:hypothetical protein n=1 Tax=Bradyrhizobium sp. AUGA SZCCT0160 TaxID=2807662 RepID=UPI001BA6E2DD|nr:hypothetical protein [Bradyrhizobium sp. AUGA SZCCT0160]